MIIVSTMNEMDKQQIERIIKELSRHLLNIKPQVQNLINKLERNPEEDAHLGQLYAMLKILKEELSGMKDHLSDELLRHSMAVYYRFREAASSGDQQAADVCKTIRPAFHQSLLTWANKYTN